MTNTIPSDMGNRKIIPYSPEWLKDKGFIYDKHDNIWRKETDLIDFEIKEPDRINLEKGNPLEIEFTTFLQPDFDEPLKDCVSCHRPITAYPTRIPPETMDICFKCFNELPKTNQELIISSFNRLSDNEYFEEFL